MTTEEKLQNFYNHSLDSANREAERVIGDHQKALDKIFEEHKATARRQAEEEVAAEIQLAMFTTQFDGQWGHPRFMRPIIDMMVDELIGTDVTVQSLGKWLRSS